MMRQRMALLGLASRGFASQREARSGQAGWNNMARRGEVRLGEQRLRMARHIEAWRKIGKPRQGRDRQGGAFAWGRAWNAMVR